MTSVVNDVVESDVDHLLGLAVRGLRGMYVAPSQDFVQTVRGRPGPSGPRVVGEGRNLRYAAIAALGLHRSPRSVQREVLAGGTAVELSALVAQRARDSADPGAVALAAWAAAEIENRCDTVLFDRIRLLVHSRQSVPTVDVAWMLSAAVAAGFVGPTADVAHQARQLLLSHQGQLGLFPHALPSESLGRFRSHVGCFADQVYPIQALARFAAAKADSDALDAANRCAARICALQGAAGQWWWHYDVRTGAVVEGYPVYSVHQHAMAPMALLDLVDAGGEDHREAIARGVRWLPRTRRCSASWSTPVGVIWRKVGRREPARRCARCTPRPPRAPRPQAPGLDRLFPTTVIDHECRPYELGWLLYAWQRATPAVPTSEAGGPQHGQ